MQLAVKICRSAVGVSVTAAQPLIGEPPSKKANVPVAGKTLTNTWAVIVTLVPMTAGLGAIPIRFVDVAVGPPALIVCTNMLLARRLTMSPLYAAVMP